MALFNKYLLGNYDDKTGKQTWQVGDKSDTADWVLPYHPNVDTSLLDNYLVRDAGYSSPMLGIHDYNVTGDYDEDEDDEYNEENEDEEFYEFYTNDDEYIYDESKDYHYEDEDTQSAFFSIDTKLKELEEYIAQFKALQAKEGGLTIEQRWYLNKNIEKYNVLKAYKEGKKLPITHYLDKRVLTVPVRKIISVSPDVNQINSLLRQPNITDALKDRMV